MSNIDKFPYPTPIPAKIGGGVFPIARVDWSWSAERGTVRLISRVIIFQEFQVA